MSEKKEIFFFKSIIFKIFNLNYLNLIILLKLKYSYFNNNNYYDFFNKIYLKIFILLNFS